MLKKRNKPCHFGWTNHRFCWCELHFVLAMLWPTSRQQKGRGQTPTTKLTHRRLVQKLYPCFIEQASVSDPTDPRHPAERASARGQKTTPMCLTPSSHWTTRTSRRFRKNLALWIRPVIISADPTKRPTDVPRPSVFFCWTHHVKFSASFHVVVANCKRSRSAALTASGNRGRQDSRYFGEHTLATGSERKSSAYSAAWPIQALAAR